MDCRGNKWIRATSNEHKCHIRRQIADDTIYINFSIMQNYILSRDNNKDYTVVKVELNSEAWHRKYHCFNKFKKI